MLKIWHSTITYLHIQHFHAFRLILLFLPIHSSNIHEYRYIVAVIEKKNIIKQSFLEFIHAHKQIIKHTSFWTIHTRSLRISCTIPNISTVSYFLMCWRIRSNAINVPDLPTPAEQCTTIGLLLSVVIRSRNDRTNLTNVFGGSGTPKSGHVVKWKCLTIRYWSPYVYRNKYKNFKQKISN